VSLGARAAGRAAVASIDVVALIARARGSGGGSDACAASSRVVCTALRCWHPKRHRTASS
jgi:hypothetical protein